MVTIHLPGDVADALLRARDWRKVREPEGGHHFVRPGMRSRFEGGKFDQDFLWDREEALTVALTEEARS